MNDPTTIIRPCSQKDLDKVRHFWTQLAQRQANNDPAPQQNPLQNIGRPNYHPEKDLFIAEREGEIVGFVDVIPELKIGRVILNTLTRTDDYKSGLTERLVELAMERAKTIWVSLIKGPLGKGGLSVFGRLWQEKSPRYRCLSHVHHPFCFLDFPLGIF